MEIDKNINVVETDYIYTGDLILYEDARTKVKDGRAEIQPPPLDPVKRHALIVKYFSVKLSLALQEFNLRKQQYLAPARTQLGYPGNPGGPPHEFEEVEKELNNLKEKVMHYRAKLEEAHKDLEDSKKSQIKPGLADQNRAAVMEYIKKVEEIKI